MTPLVETDALGLDHGSTQVLAGITWSIAPGSQTVVTGRSGSGKSTLLLLLAGLINPTRGLVRWPGLSVDPHIRRGQIGMVFQAPSLMPELTALQNVTLPLRLRGISAENARTAATTALEAVASADLAEARPQQLSGGQQQRIAVARVLAGRHALVLADEPTGSLDRAHAHQVVQTLRDAVSAAGGALVLATHDNEIAATFGETINMGLSTVRE